MSGLFTSDMFKERMMQASEEGDSNRVRAIAKTLKESRRMNGEWPSFNPEDGFDPETHEKIMWNFRDPNPTEEVKNWMEAGEGYGYPLILPKGLPPEAIDERVRGAEQYWKGKEHMHNMFNITGPDEEGTQDLYKRNESLLGVEPVTEEGGYQNRLYGWSEPDIRKGRVNTTWRRDGSDEWRDGR